MAPKKTFKKIMVYAMRVEIDGAEKIITLRVGDGFTELSLMKNGQLTEVVREEKNAIRIEKLA